ncbi:unnamed protein product [Heligmosomoides polygyrus]|uniref:Uncharacterized protein n=1 Tax=Heligmosomoides polygyrus TaxID=6339 RepID=A0A3P8D544_HELPZ|nr:unnamed protein product [Heligmosomoides polygyrus]
MVQNTNASQLDFLYGENLGFSARSVDCSVTIDDGLIDLGTTFKLFNGSLAQLLQNDPHNSIYLPIADICKVQQATHFFLTVYRNRKLFNGPRQYQSYSSPPTLAERSNDLNNAAVLLSTDAEPGDLAAEDIIPLPSPCSRQIALPADSPVMSGTVLNNGQVLAPLHGHFRVTWWDTEKLEWSSEEQCSTATDGDMIVAHCSHLTDFTLIVDASLNDPNVCDSALMDLGYSVNAISILSLMFLMFMNLSNYWPACVSNNALGYLRGYASPSRDFVSLIHKFILLLFYVVFTIFSDRKVSGSACEFFGAVSYSLLMSSVLLTIFQALRLSPVLGSVHTRARLLLLPSSSVTISLLVPSTISTLLLILTNFFDRGDCFCWVRPDYIIYAVIIPITFLLLNAVTCTIIVCYRVFGVRRKLSKSMRHRDHQIGSKILAVFLMQISLGMPWILQYLTLYSPYTTAWHYVFTIVMGSQGTVLALLFLYKRQRSMSIYRQSLHSRQSIIRNELAEPSDMD